MGITTSINKVGMTSKTPSIQMPLGFTCKNNILVISRIYIISHKYNHLLLVFTSFYCAYLLITGNLLFLLCYISLGISTRSLIYSLTHKLHEDRNTDLFYSWLEEYPAYKCHSMGVC